MTNVELLERNPRKKSTKEKSLSTVVPVEEDDDSSSVTTVNFTPQQLEVDSLSMTAKLNDRQCLTFQKRDSRLNLISNDSQGG